MIDISNRYYITHYKNANQENLHLSKSDYAFGIDLSHYNGILDWDDINNSKHPIKYIIFRASMGKDGTDKHFKKNWENAKKHHFIRGAYHYYRPSESSSLQFENFASKVELSHGDVFPVLDLGIKKGFAKFFGLKNMPSENFMIKKANKWKPYRSIAAHYFWSISDN